MSKIVIPGTKYTGTMRAANNAENGLTARSARRLQKKKKK
jgi:hypothetical protein